MDRVIVKKKWTTQRILTIVGSAVLVIFVIYQLLGDTKSKLNVETEKISISNVQKGAFQEFIAIDGAVQPIKTYYLDIIESGTVVKKFVEDGRPVEKGDTILKLTNTTLQLDFMNRESQLLDLMNQRQTTEVNMRQDEIRNLNSIADIDYQLKLAERVYERNKQLIGTNMVSQEDFKQSKDNYEYQKKRYELAQRGLSQDIKLREQRIKQLDESVNRMRKNISLSQSTLDNLYIVSPTDGQLSQLRAEIGEAKQVGENIGQIDDLTGFKVRAGIDEHYISKVYPGLNGEFEFNNKTYQLAIKKIYAEVQQGEFQVDMEFVGDAPKGIRRGQTLQIRLQLSDASQAVLIPRGGFYQTTGGNWIFVVNESGGVAERRNIKLGRQNPKFYEVLEGLKPGEKVIVSSYEGYENIEKLVLRK
ncbi:MAG: HlyD family efflux transporter periplasmic adaptor subunit [Microscillaceae bacterium]|jgi:HlyD family secretion protein|nr:HlyD family efflux transporter periplasmic adaptor subunit [Microscillaceae bacterium]